MTPSLWRREQRGRRRKGKKKTAAAENTPRRGVSRYLTTCNTEDLSCSLNTSSPLHHREHFDVQLYSMYSIQAALQQRRKTHNGWSRRLSGSSARRYPNWVTPTQAVSSNRPRTYPRIYHTTCSPPFHLAGSEPCLQELKIEKQFLS